MTDNRGELRRICTLDADCVAGTHLPGCPTVDGPKPLSVEQLAEIVGSEARRSAVATEALAELVQRATPGNCTFTLLEVHEMGWIPPASAATIGDLLGAVRKELCPVYHVTPGGLKWSRSTDALREIAVLLKRDDRA